MGAEYLRQVAILITLIAFSLLSYYLVSQYVVAAVVVQGRSMLPTLRDGERCVLNRLAYHYRNPQRDELVVIHDPGHRDLAVKRVIALPGETVQLKDGAVFVNGVRRDEPFLAPGTRTFTPNLKDLLLIVGQDQYFVLGDNRRNSEDSRHYGAVARNRIIGLLAR
jgi:signal peptidase I